MKPFLFPPPIIPQRDSPPASAVRGNQATESLQKAAEDFEALFIHMMLKAGRQGVPGEGAVPRSTGEEFFTDMLDQELGRVAAQQGGFGIAKQLVEQWKGVGSDDGSDTNPTP